MKLLFYSGVRPNFKKIMLLQKKAISLLKIWDKFLLMAHFRKTRNFINFSVKLFKPNNSGANASTFLDVSLGALTLRSLRIFVLGEVSQPGAYMIKPNSTLFTSLYYFGGPTINGSLRNIVLIRSNKEVAKIDFYDFLLFGKQDNDLRLQKDDVIFIPKRGKTVSLEGEINNP